MLFSHLSCSIFKAPLRVCGDNVCTWYMCVHLMCSRGGGVHCRVVRHQLGGLEMISRLIKLKMIADSIFFSNLSIINLDINLKHQFIENSFMFLCDSFIFRAGTGGTVRRLVEQDPARTCPETRTLQCRGGDPPITPLGRERREEEVPALRNPLAFKPVFSSSLPPHLPLKFLSGHWRRVQTPMMSSGSPWVKAQAAASGGADNGPTSSLPNLLCHHQYVLHCHQGLLHRKRLLHRQGLLQHQGHQCFLSSLVRLCLQKILLS